jgi:hypothetical protein
MDVSLFYGCMKNVTKSVDMKWLSVQGYGFAWLASDDFNTPT